MKKLTIELKNDVITHRGIVREITLEVNGKEIITKYAHLVNLKDKVEDNDVDIIKGDIYSKGQREQIEAYITELVKNSTTLDK